MLKYCEILKIRKKLNEKNIILHLSSNVFMIKSKFLFNKQHLFQKWQFEFEQKFNFFDLF